MFFNQTCNYFRACVCNHYTMIWAVCKGTVLYHINCGLSNESSRPHILIYRVRPQARVPVENPQKLKAGERAYPPAKAMPASAVAGFADSPRQLSEIAESCAG